jgi:hypothetical protein
MSKPTPDIHSPPIAPAPRGPPSSPLAPQPLAGRPPKGQVSDALTQQSI